MSEQKTWMDDLLEQVAAGKMLPQDALNQFFLHKREESGATLTQEDHAFLTAMDAAETAQVVAKWCARTAAALPGGIAAVTAIGADLRRASFFHPGRRPPLVTGLDMNGKRVMLFMVMVTVLYGAGLIPNFVVVQQMNNYAFFPEHYENGELEWHIDHILKTVSSTPKLAFHNTWPNPMDETYLKACRLGYWADNMEKWYGTGVGLWNEDLRAMQRKMHTGLVNNTVKYIESRKEAGIFEHVLFSGAAVQYSFEKLGLPNSKLYRDYTHLSNYSRLMIAYYWCCKFNGLTQLKQEDIRVEKMPKEFMFLAEEWVVTQQEKADIAAAVTFALQTPYTLPWE